MADPTRKTITLREQVIWDAAVRATVKVAHEEMDAAGAPPGNRRRPWLRDHVSKQGQPESGYPTEWEEFADIHRLKVPGGWLVTGTAGTIHVPDPGWTWAASPSPEKD